MMNYKRIIIIFFVSVLFPRILLSSSNNDSIVSIESLSIDKNSAYYFSLAQRYYKSGDIANAILNYERALRLDPSNEKIINNLNVARNSTVDKQNDTYPYIKQIFDKISYIVSPIVLMIVSICSFLVFVCLFIRFLLSRSYKKRKYSFFYSILFLVLCLFVNALLFHISYYFNDSANYGIITVRKTDFSFGENNKDIHAGTKVKVLSIDDVNAYIQLPDGTKGAVSNSDVTLIDPEQYKIKKHK